MPTSKKRTGKACANGVKPVPASIAAVIAQIDASCPARRVNSWPKTFEKLVLDAPVGAMCIRDRENATRMRLVAGGL